MRIVFALALIFCCGVVAKDLRCTLSGNAKQPFLVKFNLYNPHDEVVVISKHGTPLEGTRSNMFIVLDSKGGFLQYNGMEMRRGVATSEDVISLAAHDEVTAVIDISRQYAFENGGKYVLALNLPSCANITLSSDSVVMINLNIPNTMTPTVPAYIEDNYFNRTGALQGCINSEPSQVAAGYAGANTESIAAYDCLVAGSCNAKAQEWFGSGSYNTDIGIFKSIKTYLATAIPQNSYNAVCYPSGCPNNVYAYVYPSDSSKWVYLCNLYFTLPAERVNTIVHELSHFTVLGGTQDYTYGKASCRQLAQTDPAKAKKNADNVCYFSESV